MENIKILAGEMGSYKLIDSGEGKKLEEIGGVRIVRNEPRAWWQKSLPETEWQNTETSLEKIIDIGISGIKAKIKYKNSSKHIGIFPEQIEQWKWIEERIKEYVLSIKENTEKKDLKILNLFGYTGIASLVATKAGLSHEVASGATKWGVKVTHVDASKQSIDWARENQKLSGLGEAPIRWILDDVIEFLKREIKRRKSQPDQMGGYDAIIMDPPQFGKGPKGEVWKIEEKLPELLKACREILSDEPLFVIFNMYSTELSSISVANLLGDITKDLSGTIEAGELAIKQQPKLSTGASWAKDRLLPMSIFATWHKK